MEEKTQAKNIFLNIKNAILALKELAAICC